MSIVTKIPCPVCRAPLARTPRGLKCSSTIEHPAQRGPKLRWSNKPHITDAEMEQFNRLPIWMREEEKKERKVFLEKVRRGFMRMKWQHDAYDNLVGIPI